MIISEFCYTRTKKLECGYTKNSPEKTLKSLLKCLEKGIKMTKKLSLIEELLNRLDVPFHINNKINVTKNVSDKELVKLYEKLKSEEYFLKQIARLFKVIGDDRYKLKIVIANGAGYYFSLHGLNCAYFDTPIIYQFYQYLYVFWLGRDSTT